MSKGKTSPRTVECAVCGTPFETTHSGGKYCSPEHARAGQQASWRKYGRAHATERRAYHSEYYEQNREAVIARTSAYQQTAAGKEAARKSDATQREKFPGKYAARQAVLIALRKGQLKRQPCALCGQPKAEAHHPDYSKPLDVIWLCRLHHSALHDAHEMTAKLCASFSAKDIATDKDLADLKERGQAAIKECAITPEQKAALLGRLNTAYLERAKKFGGKKKAAA